MNWFKDQIHTIARLPLLMPTPNTDVWIECCPLLTALYLYKISTNNAGEKHI